MASEDLSDLKKLVLSTSHTTKGKMLGFFCFVLFAFEKSTELGSDHEIL